MTDEEIKSLIVSTIEQHYNLDGGSILEHNRIAAVALARHVAVYIMREDAKMRLIDVGDALDRDHSTIVHSEKVIVERMQEDDDLATDIVMIVALIEEMVGGERWKKFQLANMQLRGSGKDLG